MQPEDIQILHKKFTEKVKLMRALQRRKINMGNYFTRQEQERLNRVTREVDNMLILDSEGEKVFVKNNR